jgi:hypothetical protein
MSGRKPTLGYPSRTAAVLALRDERLTTSAIATRIGIPEKSVAALEISARRSRNMAAAGARTILFPPDLLSRLRPHAACRDMNVNALARLIVETLLDDNLIDAVLDDRAGDAA